MDAQLVRPPGLGEKPEAGLGVIRALHPPFGHGGAAVFMVDHLLGTIGPVDRQRQVDHAGLFAHPARDAGDIGLLRLTFLELQPKVALRMRRQREDHDARGVPVQPVHQERMGKGRLHAAQQAIGQVRPLAGNREQSGGLGHDQKLVILVHDIERHVGRGVVVAHDCGTSSAMV